MWMICPWIGHPVPWVAVRGGTVGATAGVRLRRGGPCFGNGSTHSRHLYVGTIRADLNGLDIMAATSRREAPLAIGTATVYRQYHPVKLQHGEELRNRAVQCVAAVADSRLLLHAEWLLRIMTRSTAPRARGGCYGRSYRIIKPSCLELCTSRSSGQLPCFDLEAYIPIVQWSEDVIKADPFFGRSPVRFRVPPWVSNTIVRDHLA